jgi:glycosyltransferase involved in cell wall biosynthesis
VTLIHAQDAGYTGLAAVVSGRILRIPVIISLHSFRYRLIELEPSIPRIFRKALLKLERSLDVFAIKNANNIMVVNSSLEEYCKQITDKKIYFFTPAIGPMERELKKFITQNNIKDKVIFCGARNDIGSILSSLDIFVLPSYTEGLSTALLEAMTCGRAIVCSDIPGNRELLTHNKEGLLVNPNDSESLKSNIQLLCNDSTLRLKLGNNAKMKASQYTEDIVFESLLKHYQQFVCQQ